MSGPLDKDGGEAAVRARRESVWRRLRVYLLSGLLVLGPTALSVFVLIRLFYWVDGLLGEYLRLPWFDYRRIPGLGLVAMLLLLLLSGWLAHRLAGIAAMRAWERALARLPLFRLIYNPSKQLGEALLSGKRTVFQQVVLVPWPHPGVWRIGLVTGAPPRALSDRVGADLIGVFVPSTPNPTGGFYHLFPRDRVLAVNLTVEQGIQMIISGGVVQPPEAEIPRGAGPREPAARS